MSTTKWIIDPAHSEVTFKVKHLMISTVTGNFKVFNGEAETESEDFNHVKTIKFQADVNSINTNNEQRDEHLKSVDFFAAENHPEIKFEATNFDANKGEIIGDLTIRGKSKPVTLDVEFGGVVTDGYGQTKAGLTVTGKISRKEFGLTWNDVTEAGSIVVSDQVRMSAEVQLIKQA
ncbi:MAG TPA: YceI family protein [Salinimicrobium sp.]|nr:YceI family protein [Salinimicrobium sp.]